MSKKYKIEVKTGNVSSGGTDSDIWIELLYTNGREYTILLDIARTQGLLAYSSNGVLAGVRTSGRIELNTPADDFERNQLDTFIVSAPDVGEIDGIYLVSSRSDAWYVSWVQVTDMSSGLKWKATCNAWLDKLNPTEGNAYASKWFSASRV